MIDNNNNWLAFTVNYEETERIGVLSIIRILGKIKGQSCILAFKASMQKELIKMPILL